MKCILILAICNVSLILAHLQLINEDFGDFHFQAQAGQLPPKYYPMTEHDIIASEKAADIMDFIQLVPQIDPFVRNVLEPLGIDLPFLWFKGKVFMTNFVLAGVKSFEVRSLELRLNNLRSDLNITLPDIYVEGDFNLQASVGFLPILLSCHLSFHVMNMDISVAAGSKLLQAPSVGEVLQIDSTAIRVDIQNIRVNVSNLAFGASETETGLAIAQLFASPTHDNMYDGILMTALGIVNKELFKVPSTVFRNYLMTN